MFRYSAEWAKAFRQVLRFRKGYNLFAGKTTAMSYNPYNPPPTSQTGQQRVVVQPIVMSQRPTVRSVSQSRVMCRELA